MRGGYQTYVVDYHPFDVVGWDGYLYPWTFSIHDFEPITGRIHQPPPSHQTFQGQNFVICSFCPRKLDFDPQAVPIPYHHSNLQSEEMIYYVSGNFGSRKGVEVGSITLHPSGLPHGPQPGLAEKSIGMHETHELAVMCDTFNPLQLTTFARDLDDGTYWRSWYENAPDGDAAEDADASGAGLTSHLYVVPPMPAARSAAMLAGLQGGAAMKKAVVPAAAGVGALVLARRKLRNLGATRAERRATLPGRRAPSGSEEQVDDGRHDRRAAVRGVAVARPDGL